MIKEMVHFCAPSKWSVIFFDQVDQWMESRRYKPHEYETDAAAYCAYKGLHVAIQFCHVELEADRRTLACAFCWKTEVEREFFFRELSDADFVSVKAQPSEAVRATIGAYFRSSKLGLKSCYKSPGVSGSGSSG